MEKKVKKRKFFNFFHLTFERSGMFEAGSAHLHVRTPPYLIFHITKKGKEKNCVFV